MINRLILIRGDFPLVRFLPSPLRPVGMLEPTHERAVQQAREAFEARLTHYRAPSLPTPLFDGEKHGD